jgi:hypothetical protein
VANERDSPIRTEITMDFSGGVNSYKAPTQSSLKNPNGLNLNQAAWLVNATMRGGTVSPRDAFVKVGNIDGALEPYFVPGTPQQTIPQPNLPPVQTPPVQTFTNETDPYWTVPPIGSQVTILLSGAYVGNVGDMFYDSTDPPARGPGTFLVISFSGNQIILQYVAAGQTGSGALIFKGTTLQANNLSLGPGIPQPSIIVPAQPDTYNPGSVYWQGALNPLYAPPGQDSYSTNGQPYGLCVIGGQIIAFDPTFTLPPTNLSSIWGESFLPNTTGGQMWPRCFFVQSGQFVVIQAGDYDSTTGNGQLPIFWDGFKLTRSNGLTGITAVGELVPNTFTLSITGSIQSGAYPTITTDLTATWTPPPVGETVTLVLTAPYGTPAQQTQNAQTTQTGNSNITNTQTSTAIQAAQALQHLGDNLTIYNSEPNALGVFRVVTISGVTITVETIELFNDSLQTPGAFACTLTLPPNNTSVVELSKGTWAVPPATQKGMITLTSIYFGSVGDTVTVFSTDGSINYGTFKVISFNSVNQLVLQTISSNFAGQQVAENSFVYTVTAVRSFTYGQSTNNQSEPSPHWTIPGVGSTSFLYFSKNTSAYTGSSYDIVTVTETATGAVLGTFRVIPYTLPVPAPFLEQVLLETLQSNFVGTTIGASVGLLFTVVAPPTNPQLVYLTSGMWTMPNVGGSVTLQMVFNPSQTANPPPWNFAYPGNVGDIVTLELTSPISYIGQFEVDAFDSLGNVTLSVVQPTVAGVSNAAPGTGFSGVITANLTIVQVPSTGGALISQIPAAGPMVYYGDIIWYSQGDIASGGDIAGGPSGTSYYNFLDSVLCVTENPLAFGGDGFKLPIPGPITGMAWPAQINAALGQGLLYIATLNGICSLQVPPTRTAWIAANAANPPQLNVVQFNNGWVNDLCVVSYNGDLYFQSLEPGIRSVILAERYFQQQGNVMISNNEQRILQFVNTALLNNATGILFNNRLLQSSLPTQTTNGVVHAAIIPLDFDPISTLEEQLPPNWEGMYEGLQVFQLLSGTVNGVLCGYAVTLSQTTPGEIDLWQIVPSYYADNNGIIVPIQWQMETPAFTWEKEADLKELVGLSIWVDEIVGEVIFKVEWRPDFASCWSFWCEWSECFAPDTLHVTDVNSPSPYPIQLPPGYKPSMDLPMPPNKLQTETGRPASQGFQFQFRITVTGQARIRAIAPHCQDRKKGIYDFIVASGKKLLKALGMPSL